MKILHISLLLLLISMFSCENEPIDRADPSKVIAVDSELYKLIQRAAGNGFENELTCIDFNYAFTLVVYDETMDIVAEQIIRSDLEFSDFLGGLDDGKSISLSYPITSILDNGYPFEIRNNEELKAALDQCVEADTVISCTTILTETSCIWKITHLDGPNNQYEGAYFEVSPYGNAGLYFQDHSFAGTWITYFIENDLHLNIFITGDEELSADWNFDWKVVNFDESQMEIENGTDRFLLVKSCLESCRKILFEECETEPSSGIAIFDLESYFDCFFPFTGISDPSIVSWNYYETEEDMNAGINPIENLLFNNVFNPQIIYVRFDDITTGEMVTSISIILKAIKC